VSAALDIATGIFLAIYVACMGVVYVKLRRIGRRK